MIRTCSIFAIVLIMACGNQAASPGRDSAAPGKTNVAASSGLNESTGCGTNIYFLKGSVIESSIYDGVGKLNGKSRSEVVNVKSDGAMVQAGVSMQSTDAAGANPKEVNGIYRCDGSNFYMDAASMGAGTGGGSISTSGLPFPLKLTVGSSLPDAAYDVKMKQGDKEMVIRSQITERKVEAFEKLNVAGAEFNCYRISSTINASTEFPGMTDELKQRMAEAKARMGKTRMVIWYDPAVAVLKMEYYMADKLITRNEVTKISRK